MKKIAIILAVISTLSSSLTANANLITNGGFESGLDGWTCSGADYCDASSELGSHTGVAGAFGYDKDGFATLSQVISTVAGVSYDFSFFSKASQVSDNILRYSFSDFDNSVLVPTTNEYAETIGSFIANSDSTNIQFYFSTLEGTGTWRIDDVSVAAVPVPAALPLMASALAAFGIARRRNKSQAV